MVNVRLKKVVVRERSLPAKEARMRPVDRPKVEPFGWSDDRLIREARKVDPIEGVEVELTPANVGGIFQASKRMLRNLWHKALQ